MTLPELRNGISQLLAQADTPGAMDLLHQFAVGQGRKDVVNAVVTLRARFGRVRAENARGVLSQPDLDLGMNKINSNIVELLDQLESPPKPLSSVWLRVGLFAGIMALAGGFLLFQYLPDRQTQTASVPQATQPINQGASDAGALPVQNGSTSGSLKNSMENEPAGESSGNPGGENAASKEKPHTPVSPNQGHPSSPPPAQPHSASKFTITLRMDSPWHHAKVLVDGKEWPLDEDLDYTKKIRLTAGAHVITLRMADGRTCEQSRSVSENTTVYFTCNY